MKVALIELSNSIIADDKRIDYEWDKMSEFKSRQRLWSCPNLSLLTIAGMLDNADDITYIDTNYSEIQYQNYDIAFFSPSTSQIYQAYGMADIFRRNGTRVVMGGSHVSFKSEEALQHTDTIFIGEAEETFPIFLRDIKSMELKRVYRAEKPPSLKLSPIPRYDLAGKYMYKSIPIQASRGCPHQCGFCVSSKIYGKRCRRKDIEQLRREIVAISEIWERPFLFFTDDNMFINKSYAEELVKLLKEFSLKWYAFTDASIANRPDLLGNIYKSGCSQLLIGFESLSKENLSSLNSSGWKMKKMGQYFQIIEAIQSNGIGVVGSFVIGFDGDGKNVFDDLYDFILKTKLYATNITILTPFPGTRLYSKLKQEGRLLTEDWSKFNGFELTYETVQFTQTEFEEGFKNLYKRLNSPERINSILHYFKNNARERSRYSIKGR